MRIKDILRKMWFMKFYYALRKNIVQMYYRFLPEKKHLDIMFYKIFGRHIDWENPKSFNEKLQWLKINDRNPEHIKLVDKYAVREYIKEAIGEEYLIPLIGVWDKVDDIDFDSLPDSFVLKCTHGSGCNIVCSDKSKLNIKEAKKKLKKWMKINYYYLSREWPYKAVKPRIICEKFMRDCSSDDLRDYKFFCFNGKMKCGFVASERQTDDVKFNFFDREWNELPFENYHLKLKEAIDKPINFSKMIELSEILSSDEIFLRVDFYEINDKIFFGELTFYHGAGFLPFNPEKYDYILGDWLKLTK